MSGVETTIARATAAATAEALDARLARIEAALAELRERPRVLVDRRGLAVALDCSVRTIATLLADGCPHVRLGGPNGAIRFDPAAVVAWLAGRHDQEAAAAE